MLEGHQNLVTVTGPSVDFFNFYEALDCLPVNSRAPRNKKKSLLTDQLLWRTELVTCQSNTSKILRVPQTDKLDHVQSFAAITVLRATCYKGHTPKPPQPKRSQPKRPENGTVITRNPKDRKGQKLKRPLTEKTTYRNGHKPERLHHILSQIARYMDDFWATECTR